MNLKMVIAGPAVAALSLALAGCSGSTKTVTRPTVTVERTTTTTVTASANTETAPTSASPVKNGSSSMALGDTFKIAGATVQVISYKESSSPSAPPPVSGGRWDSIQVRVCVEAGGSVSWSPWNLLDTSDASYDGSSEQYNQFPAPAYPDGDHPVAAGQCVRGWITFPVSSSARINAITYTTQEGNGPVEVGRWAP